MVVSIQLTIWKPLVIFSTNKHPFKMSEEQLGSSQLSPATYVNEFKEWMNLCKSSRSIAIPPPVPPPFVIYFYVEQDEVCFRLIKPSIFSFVV